MPVFVAVSHATWSWVGGTVRGTGIGEGIGQGLARKRRGGNKHQQQQQKQKRHRRNEKFHVSAARGLRTLRNEVGRASSVVSVRTMSTIPTRTREWSWVNTESEWYAWIVAPKEPRIGTHRTRAFPERVACGKKRFIRETASGNHPSFRDLCAGRTHAPWSRGPGRGTRRGHRQRSVVGVGR